ncbi:ornithine cyclodeaminase family protein [Leucobacter tenebrionis]|uniref:ornithine cyclodeaminase family protein n=1 Tax=Leucobacter tenebrionis TaxID=2873270 RepID=UPI001CA6FCAA|nr:hypothetical protein [Leucobacter tenebrionis]QZY50635.1 hypothetical protein KVY00_08200 [Leucobacter tenebrionis]
MSSEDTPPPAPPLFLTDADVQQLSDWDDAIATIRAAYAAPEDDGRTPGRIFAQTSREWTRIMPSIPASGRLFGSKAIVGSFADGLQVSYLISLFDKSDAALVALIDGNRVTGLRTAATTAVAAAAITPGGPLSIGIVGSGFEARSHLEALSRVLEVSEIRIFSPTEANRERFASEVDGAYGAPAWAVASAEAAARGADLLLCAARSRDESPTVQAEWVGDSATVLSIGSTTPAQRELPVELLERAATIVVDTFDEVVHGSGDMLAAAEAGVAVEHKTVTLNAVLTETQRVDPEQGIRIYKSTGSGLQDIAVAEMLVERAQRAGTGTRLPVGIVTSRK